MHGCEEHHVMTTGTVGGVALVHAKMPAVLPNVASVPSVKMSTQ